MSRWPGERVQVGIAEDGSGMLLAPRHWPRRAQLIDAEPAAVGVERWHAAAESVRALLQRVPKGVRRVRVVLSDGFVRYAVVPWSGQLEDPSERVAYARSALRGIHGDATAAWPIALDSAPYGRAALAAAVDARLWEHLRETADTCGVRIDSLQPHCVAALNHHRRRCRDAVFCFAVEETSRVTLAFRAGGAWIRLRSIVTDGQAPADDAAFVDVARREAALLGLDGSKLPIFACAARPRPAPPSGGQVTWLPTVRPASPGAGVRDAFAMAMLA